MTDNEEYIAGVQHDILVKDFYIILLVERTAVFPGVPQFVCLCVRMSLYSLLAPEVRKGNLSGPCTTNYIK